MKKFDAVVLGSTGYAGRLVCRHIVDNYHGKVEAADIESAGFVNDHRTVALRKLLFPRENNVMEIRWAMAGRNREKLENVRAELLPDAMGAQQVDILEADVMDPASLRDLASSTHVVITMVGPYALYGRPVVQACIENGTHYCDITAEAQYIQRNLEEFAEPAKEAGVRIVHSCGLDSVPSEVMTLMAAHHMQKRHGAALGEVTYTVDGMMGGFSGGTIESFVQFMRDRIEDPALAKMVSHPYSLIPHFPDMKYAETEALPDKGSSWGPQWSEAAQSWGGPFVMHFHNEKIVRMSNALLGWKLGKDMIYSERMGVDIVTAALSSMVMNVCAGLVAGAARFQWLREKLPQPGEGPTDEELDAGYFRLSCWALPEHADKASETPARVHSQFADENRDGGYLSTARMILECGLCMIPDNEPLLKEDPYASKCPAGVLSPSAAFGLVLHERLKAAEYELSVADAPLPSATSSAEVTP